MQQVSQSLLASRINWSLIGFAGVLFLPSTAIFQKYLGLPGVVFYVVIASIPLIGFIRYNEILRKSISKVSERNAILISIAILLIVFLLFLIVYPMANSGLVGGGSDSDDALNIAVSELLNGHYPYYPKTYLGNSISPLPGALLLATPFVLIGNSAYQNIFWLLVFIVNAKLFLQDQRLVLLLLVMLLGFSPAVLYTVMIGSDYLSNGLYALIFIMGVISAVPRGDLPGWKKALPSIFLGIGLSSRANFLFLLPLVFAYIVKFAGWKSAVNQTAIIIFTFSIITIPFYVYDPAGFTPLQTIDEISRFNTILSHASLFLPMLTGVTALLLAAFRRSQYTSSLLFKDCTLVLALPILGGVILSSIQFGRPDFKFALFGVFFLFFGAVAFWGDLFGKYWPVRS